MSPSIMICPATCELCGQWMPGHSKDCPRSGVHPSQWALSQSEDSSAIRPQVNDDLVTWEGESSLVFPGSARSNNMTIGFDDY